MKDFSHDANIPTRSKLAIKGDAKIVSDFFEYSLQSILYQRGVYPATDFKLVRKYGLNMLVSIDEEVLNYISRIMSQIKRWIYSDIISKLVIALVSKETGDVTERWRFDIHITKNDGSDAESIISSSKSKSTKEIQREIQAIIRQITASVTFLPELSGPHTFNVLVYANPNCKVPTDWDDSDAKNVGGKSVESVKFKTLSTSYHSVSTFVTYKIPE